MRLFFASVSTKKVFDIQNIIVIVQICKFVVITQTGHVYMLQKLCSKPKYYLATLIGHSFKSRHHRSYMFSKMHLLRYACYCHVRKYCKTGNHVPFYSPCTLANIHHRVYVYYCCANAAFNCLALMQALLLFRGVQYALVQGCYNNSEQTNTSNSRNIRSLNASDVYSISEGLPA